MANQSFERDWFFAGRSKPAPQFYVKCYSNRNMNLSQFQIKCENQLQNLLNNHQQEIIDRTIEGENERYVKGRISGSNFWFFIYVDEAGIQGASLDLRFERPDYDSLEDLSEAFLSAVSKLIGT